MLSTCFCPPLLFFFSTLLPPPRSTLFPYTTLFRSQRKHLHLVVERLRNWLALDVADVGFIDLDNRARATQLDRKSTRLNSSHLGISYAVFCLKKKKNKTQ